MTLSYHAESHFIICKMDGLKAIYVFVMFDYLRFIENLLDI